MTMQLQDLSEVQLTDLLESLRHWTKNGTEANWRLAARVVNRLHGLSLTTADYRRLWKEAACEEQLER